MSNPLEPQTITDVVTVHRPETRVEQLKRVFALIDNASIGINSTQCADITHGGCSVCPLKSRTDYDGYGCLVNILRSVARDGNNAMRKIKEKS